MKEKLLALMQNEGLKPSRLAEMLDVNPAGISHILNGRNKPGFDFLQKILRRFPRISPDWLLLDSGPMYRDTEASPLTMPADQTPQPQTGNTGEHQPAGTTGDLFTARQSTDPANVPPTATPGSPVAAIESFLPKIPNRAAAVNRVVIFYDDNSFEAYFPTVR